MKNSEFLKDNSITIQNELNWLSSLIDNRLDYFFSTKEDKVFIKTDTPDLDSDKSNMSNFITSDSSYRSSE